MISNHNNKLTFLNNNNNNRLTKKKSTNNNINTNIIYQMNTKTMKHKKHKKIIKNY